MEKKQLFFESTITAHEAVKRYEKFMNDQGPATLRRIYEDKETGFMMKEYIHEKTGYVSIAML